MKRFKKKFEEKTKNKWDARQNFTPVEGKYTLVVEKSGSSNSNKDTKSQVAVCLAIQYCRHATILVFLLNCEIFLEVYSKLDEFYLQPIQ